MKLSRWLALAGLLTVGAASALPLRYVYESQACSAGTCARSAVPSAATEGMSLVDVSGFRVSVCAASGQTLSGAGTLQAYLYHNDAQVWMRNPSLDQTVSVSGTSCLGSACRCQVFADLTTGARIGHRVVFAASGVTVSGGSAIDVRIDGQTAGNAR